jgi:GMP synthase (glutamine-hydrolysing)
MKPVVIVQHEPSVPPGLIARGVTDAQAELRIFEAWREAEWPAVDDIGALVVMGGTMNVDQVAEHPFLRESRDLMAAAIENEVPTLGVCLGSQMMARVLGSEVRRADPRNALFSTLMLTEDGASDPLTAPFDGVEVLQFHEDTFDVPAGAVPLATSAHSSLAQAFRYGANAYAIQFHFEVDRPILEGWLDNIGRRQMLGDWGSDPADLLHHADEVLPRQSQAGERLVQEFLRLLR